MRSSDWSSDVCSSDLKRGSSWPRHGAAAGSASCSACWLPPAPGVHRATGRGSQRNAALPRTRPNSAKCLNGSTDRKSVGEGKSVSVSVDFGGRRYIKKNKTVETHKHHM